MRLVLIVAALTVLSSSAHATTWRVRTDGGGNFTTIQAGLAAAGSGDTVEVGCGTYHEAQLVMKSGVLLTSATGSADCVTVDPASSGRGFWCSGVDSAATIRGFTVTNGLATFGGGIYVGSLSRLAIERCVFRQDTADVGGGAYIHHSSPRLSACTMTADVATSRGGGLACEDDADPRFEDCAIVGNRAGWEGGGVWCYLGSDATLRRCAITGNAAASQGGGLHAFGSRPSLVSCTLAGNAAEEGGAVGLWRAAAAIDSSLLWGHCAAAGVTLLADSSSTVRFSCCDVDTAAGWRSGLGAVSWPGANLAVDPLFCAPAPCSAAPTGAGGYGLLPGSLCLPPGPGGCGRIGDPNAGTCPSAAP